MTPIEIDELIVSAMPKEKQKYTTELSTAFTAEEEAIIARYKEALAKLGTERAASRKTNKKPAFRLGSYKFGK